MKKIIFFSVAFALFYYTSFAQQKPTLYGKIYNEDEKPISAVHVTLLRSNVDSTVVAFTTTDDKGNFKIANTGGIRPIKFTCLGYAPKILLADSGDLGIIFISPESFDIEEVTVKQKRKTYRPDGITYIPSASNIDNSVNGMDLLAGLRPPRVRIDPVSYNITALGGGEVVLLINNRPASISELRGLNPDLIRRIDYYDKPTTRFPEASVVIDITVSHPLRGGSISGDLMEGLTATYGEHFLAGNIYSGRHNFSLEWNPQFRRSFTQMRERKDIFNFPSNEFTRTEDALPARLIYWNNEMVARYIYTGRAATIGVSAFKQLDKTWNNDFSGKIVTENNTSTDTTLSHEHNAERTSDQGVNIYSEINTILGPFIINANYRQGNMLYQREFSELDNINNYFTSSKNTEKRNHAGLKGSYSLPLPISDDIDGLITWNSSWNGTWFKNKFISESLSESNSSIIQNNGSNSLALAVMGEKLMFYLGIVNQWQNYKYSSGEKEKWSKWTPLFSIAYNPLEWWQIDFDLLMQHQQPPMGQLIENEMMLDAFQIQRTNPNLQKEKFNQYTLNNTFTLGAFEIWLQAKYQHYKNPIMDITLLELLPNGYAAVRTQENMPAFHRYVLNGSINCNKLFGFLSLNLYGGCDYNHSDGGEHYQHKGWYPYTNSQITLEWNKFKLLTNIWYGHDEALWGEILKTATFSTRFMLSYQHKRLRASVGVMNPFIKSKETRYENLSAVSPYVRYTYNQSFQNMVFARVEFNLSWGDKQRWRTKQELDASKPESTVVKSER